MTTVDVNPEFGIELALALPYAYWLHENNQLEKVVTSKGMKPFYYFCDNVEEKYDYRTIDNNAANMHSLPNPWIYGTQLDAKLYKDEWEHWESFYNAPSGVGILNYTEWKLPDYNEQYKNDRFLFDKPFIVVANTKWFNSLSSKHKEIIIKSAEIAEKDVRIAQLNRNSSAALLLPSISASNSFRETSYGNSIITGSESYSGGVNLSQSLFNFGGKVNSVRQSNNSYQITKIQKRQTTSRIILNVYTFYYQHLKDSELYEIAKEDLNLSKRQLDLVKQRFDLGAVSKTDYLKATVRYGSAKSTLLTRELSFNNSFKNLRNSMGLIGTDTKISLPKKVEINLIIPSFDEAYQLMLSNSPSLNILDRRVTSAKIGVKQSWASSLPSLSMSLGYNATSSDQITKQYFEDNYIKSANLTLSIPLFNGFRKRNDIKISKLQLSKSEASLGTAKKDAEVELYSSLNRLNNYEELIPIQQEILLSAEEDLKLAEQKYELGSADILELLDAQLAVIQASSSLVTTKYDAAIQMATLDNIIGTLDRKYK